jgi:hypothetical protein
MVLVGLKTPLLKVNEVLVVALIRHDSGIVKQQGIVFVGVVLGWKTPS